MSTQETTAVHIANSDDVDALVERLPDLKDERVLITVSEESDALLTAAEFHRVMAKARESNIGLTISTQDHLRQELARMLGWVVVDTVSGSGSRGNTENLPSRGGDTEDIDGAWTRLHTTADLATYRPPVPTNGNGKSNGNGSGSGHTNKKDVTGTIIVDQEVAEKLIELKPEPRPANGNAANGRASRIDANDDDYTEHRERRRFPRPSRRAAILVAAIGAPLIVLAIVAGILMYILPTATVTLMPTEKSISADLVYGLATSGSHYDVSIQPSPVTHTTIFDKQIPTTGERFEPDGSAAGTVLLTNPQLDAVTIPSGTALPGKNGITYITQKDVTIPKADPFVSQSFGSASVPVVAATAGDQGNTDAGTVVGQLDSGVFFNNSQAISGGTMKRIPVVSQADIDALKQAAEADLASNTVPEFQASIDQGLQLVPNSQTTSDPTYQFSLNAGQDGADISVHATQTVTAEVFDPGKLNALAKDEAARQLASKAGSNEIILGDTVTIGDPVPLSDGLSFTRHATARTRAVISSDEQAALEKQIVGKNKQDAEAVIQTMSDVSSYSLKIKPDWLPQRMPELNSHIKVVVSSTDGTSSSP